jgi:lipopolysaccharide transport system permease protein
MTGELAHAVDYGYRIYKLRYFWLSLVRNDVQNRYRRSFLGIAWSLARPLGLTIVLSIMVKGFALAPGQYVTRDNYTPFLFLGITLWQFMVECMSVGCGTFKSSSAFIRQQPIPLAIFPIRTVLASALHAGFALLVGTLILWYFVGLPSPLVLLAVVPGFAIILLLGIALATLMGIVHTHYPDTQHILEIVLQAMFFMTPVFFPPDNFTERGKLSMFITWNPFTSVLEVIRRPLLTGELEAINGFHLLQAGGFLLLIGGLAWWCLRRFEKDLVYWI